MRICFACLLALVMGCAGSDPANSGVRFEKKASVEELIANLKQEDPAERQKAAAELKLKGEEAKESVPALAEALKDKEKSVRDAAAEALVAIGVEGRLAGVPVCLELMKGDEEAGKALLTQLSPTSIQVLELGKADPAKRREVAGTLVGAKGPDLVEAIPVLLDIRKQAGADRDVDLIAMVDYVAKYGKLAQPEAVPALIEGLDSDDPHVRAGTLVILDRLGDKAKAVVPTLRKCMQEATANNDKAAYDKYFLTYKKITGFQGAATSIGATNLGDAWASDFPSFLEQLRFIIGPNPTWPHETDDVLAIVAGNTKEWLVPSRYPYKGPNIKFENTTGIFHEKSVEWELEVDNVAVDPETKRVNIHFKPPTAQQLQRIHPKLNEMGEFYVTLDDKYKAQAQKLTLGQKVTIKADVGHEPLDGIYLLFGVGKYANQIHLNIRLRKGIIIR
ncbi:MAG: HEAT repeat domain-containing protein [Gemmataceae bacterium]